MAESSSRSQSFNPLQGLTWTAETNVSLMKKLVRERDDIFKRHRYFNDESRQRQSFVKARGLTTDTAMRPCLDRYSEFCTVVNIPTFPLSASTIALFMFTKCSFQNSYYETTSRRLRRIKRETDGLWEDFQEYEDLMKEDDEILDALRRFFAERKDVRVRSKRAHEESISKPRKRSKARSESDDSDSDLSNLTTRSDDDGSDCSDDEGDRAWRQRKALESKPETQVSIPPLGTPNVPQNGDRFANIEDLLVACYRAVLPVFANGCSIAESQNGVSTVIECSRAAKAYLKAESGQCKWKVGAVVDPETNELVVSEEKSHLVHNHGPSTRIIKQPNWRPPVKNAIVRKAFGMPPLASASKEKKKPRPTASFSSNPSNGSSPNIFDQPSKKLKYSPYQFDAFETPQYSPYASMPSIHPLNNQLNSQVSNSSHFVSNPQFASPRFPSTPSQLVPVPAHGFSMPQPQSTSSIVSTSLAQIPSPELSPFFPQLEQFLRALHPSLSSLAIPIFSAGIDSFDTLCKFNAFESETLAKFLKVIRSQDVKQEISLVHLRLLQKKLDEAKSRDWSG